MQTQFSKQQAIEEITRRLVEFYTPVRIYLFGSEARGEAGPDSDLDFLVVVPDDAPEDKLRPGAGRRAVRGTGFAKDIVPWRKTDFEDRAAWVKSSLPATVVPKAGCFMKPSEARVLIDSNHSCGALFKRLTARSLRYLMRRPSYPITRGS
jgi:uncharacterized protein